MLLVSFLKMHGAGNDFVVLDARKKPLTLSPAQARRVADRRFGIGCDQVIVLESSQRADLFMRIYNPDGTEAASCGNATRCMAWRVMEETKTDTATIETRSGILHAERAGVERVRVDMGAPGLEWREIPLAQEVDTLRLDIVLELLSGPTAVSMGNPHMVFFVEHVESFDLEAMGPILEHHPLFPDRANVSIAQINAADDISLRVWERGAGETLACGTAACATLVAAHRRGRAGRSATLHLPGGDLFIEWAASNHVWMTGPVATSFEGKIRL